MPFTTDALRLAQARDAYHEIVTGKAVQKFVDQNGESVQYNVANAGDLLSYIRQLEGAAAGSKFRTPRPIGFLF